MNKLKECWLGVKIGGVIERSSARSTVTKDQQRLLGVWRRGSYEEMLS
jgi:hypothetical protein